jgi:hypothetical protein
MEFCMSSRCTRFARLISIAGAAVLLPGFAAAQAKHYALESAENVTLHNVMAETVTHQGKKGLRLAFSEEARRRFEQSTPEERARLRLSQLALIKGLEFSSGVIAVELAGEVAPGAPEAARGFVGVAFRVQPDNETYDAFYLRPTNGRAEDQERRNHAAQYVSHPDWPWFRLRKETPSKYEAYVDLVPGAWTKVRIEVRGSTARLYVHDNEQPTLIVNDVKSGANGKGAVALWLDSGTIAHFRNLTVESK